MKCRNSWPSGPRGFTLSTFPYLPPTYAAGTGGGPPWFGADESSIIPNGGRKYSSTLIEALGLVRRQFQTRLVIMGRFSESYRAGLIAQAWSYGVEKDLGLGDQQCSPDNGRTSVRVEMVS